VKDYMSDHLTNNELFKLFEAVLTERAVGEEFRRLESMLDEDQQVRDLYALYSQLHVDLRYNFRTGAVDPEELLSAEPLMESKPASPLTQRSKLPRIGWMSLGLAATLFVAIFLSLVFPRGQEEVPNVILATTVRATKPPEPVATLTMHRDVVWEGSSIIKGQAIREGEELRLLSGETRISMGIGAEIVAKGPCAMRFVSRDRVQLEFGEVTVYVAEWAKGFTVVTDSMEVIDLGTTFTVNASKEAGAEASVLKGQVRVNPHKKLMKGPRTVLVSEGEALSVDSDGRRQSRLLAPLEATDRVDFSGLEPYRPVLLYNTGIGFAEGDEDPNWRVIAGPEDSFDGPQFAMVCVPDERYLSNDPRISQWVSMANWRTAKANSVYTFQTTFDLTGYDLDTIQLFGRFLADNGIQEVRVNGNPVKVDSWTDNVPDQSFGQPQFRTVSVTDGLVQGTNIVEIDVWNGVFQPVESRKTTPNPMALRVEWYAFGRQDGVAADAQPKINLNQKTGAFDRDRSDGISRVNRFVNGSFVVKWVGAGLSSWLQLTRHSSFIDSQQFILAD